MRAIIFDLDGTIVDSHRYTFDAFRYAVSPYRGPLADQEICAAFGPSERVILSRFLPAAEAPHAYARLQEFYASHVDALRVHPAMRPVLRDCLAAGLRCGLFTGRGADSTQLILSRLDLTWAFAAVVAGDQAGRPKPAPDGVLQLLEALGCTASETLVVGDSSLDCEAARAAGTVAVFATWHGGAGAIAPAGIPSLADPDALRPYLGLAPHDAGRESSG